MAGESSSGRAADIAKSVFIEDVGAFMGGKQVEDVLLELQERQRRLRSYEAQVLAQRKRFMEKLPEINKSLEAVGALVAARDAGGGALAADFELTDGIFARAEVKDVENVGLWLGAGVMCEYPLDEARALLSANKAQCEGSLQQQQDNLGLLKDAITITDVNTARVFNWDVERRRAVKAG